MLVWWLIDGRSGSPVVRASRACFKLVVAWSDDFNNVVPLLALSDLALTEANGARVLLEHGDDATTRRLFPRALLQAWGVKGWWVSDSEDTRELCNGH